MNHPLMHIQDLKWYTLRIHESGLLQFWELMSYFDVKELGIYEKLVDSNDVRNPLDLRSLTVAWTILITGCSLAEFVLIFEILV